MSINVISHTSKGLMATWLLSFSQRTIGAQKKQKPNFPSGLINNWQSKISAVARGSSKATIVAYSGNSLGGLDDEDMHADVAATLALDVGNHNLNDVRCFLCQQHLLTCDSACSRG